MEKCSVIIDGLLDEHTTSIDTQFIRKNKAKKSWKTFAITIPN